MAVSHDGIPRGVLARQLRMPGLPQHILLRLFLDYLARHAPRRVTRLPVGDGTMAGYPPLRHGLRQGRFGWDQAAAAGGWNQCGADNILRLRAPRVWRMLFLFHTGSPYAALADSFVALAYLVCAYAYAAARQRSSRHPSFHASTLY